MRFLIFCPPFIKLKLRPARRNRNMVQIDFIVCFRFYKHFVSGCSYQERTSSFLAVYCIMVNKVRKHVSKARKHVITARKHVSKARKHVSKVRISSAGAGWLKPVLGRLRSACLHEFNHVIDIAVHRQTVLYIHFRSPLNFILICFLAIVEKLSEKVSKLENSKETRQNTV